MHGHLSDTVILGCSAGDSASNPARKGNSHPGRPASPRGHVADVRAASDASCACDRYPYCGCGRAEGTTHREHIRCTSPAHDDRPGPDWKATP